MISRRKGFLILGLIFGGFLASLAFLLSGDTEYKSQPNFGSVDQPFNIIDINNQTISSCDWNDKIVLYNFQSDIGWLKNMNKSTLNNIEIIHGDIRDYDLMLKISKRVDVIINLAALIGIPYSYDAPKSYIDTNIIGTYNILEAARENNVELIVNTSTSEVYGSAQYVPIDEKHPLNAQSPYAASKIAADQ